MIPADPSPSKKPAVPADAGDAPPLGLDVRYVDEDGNFKTLRVDDFPR